MAMMCIFLRQDVLSICYGVPFAFATFSSVSALYQARRRPWAAALVGSAYLNLLALLSCVRLLESTPSRDLRRRRRLQLAVVVLATTLNANVCYQVSRMMPPAVSAVLWSLAALVSAFGLFLLYLGDGLRLGNPATVAP